METTYLICAAIGGTLIVCQFVMTLFGLGGGHDLHGGDHVDAGGHDAAGDHHVGHGNESTWFLGILTFRTISAALAFFGLTGVIGLRSDMEPLPTLAMAVAAGVAALFLVAYLMRALSRLNIDGTLRIEKSVGCTGTVYVPIPGSAGGLGKVHVHVLDRTLECKATSKDALPTGAKIVVVGVIGVDTVEVAPTPAP
jgi:membrane protein implicated in regulation of membrane protease activity